MRTVKFPLPRRLTLPSMSTSTEGTFSRTSTAVPEVAVVCWLTLMTFLSISKVSAGRSAVTSAPSSAITVASSNMSPRSTRGSAGEMLMVLIFFVCNPMKETSIKYCPGRIPVIWNCPSRSVIVPVTCRPSRRENNTIFAYSTGCVRSASSTLPAITPPGFLSIV